MARKYLDKEKIEELYNSGLSGSQIAEQLDYSPTGVNRVLREIGVDRSRQKNKQIPHEECLLIIEKYQECSSMNLTAQKFGISHKTVSGILQRYEISKQTPSHPSPNNKINKYREQILDLFILEGLGAEKISSIIPLSKSTIWRSIGDSKTTSLEKLEVNLLAIKARAENGEDLVKIARDYEVTKPTILKFIRKKGIKRPKQVASPKTDKIIQNKEEVLKRFNSGDNLSKICRDLGLSRNLIKRVIQELELDFGNIQKTLEENRDKIKELVQQGKSDREIGKIFSCSKDSIWGFRKKHNIDSLPTLEEAHGKEIVERYRGGEDSVQLGAAYSVSYHSILSILHKAGIQPRPRRERTDREIIEENLEEIKEMVLAGSSYGEVARHFGIASTSTISSLLDIQSQQRENQIRLEKLREANIDEMVKMWQDGDSVSNIAINYGINPELQNTWLKNAGCDTSRGYKSYSGEGQLKDYTEEIVKSYREGRGIDSIGVDYGVFGASIKRVLQNAGIELRKHEDYWYDVDLDFFSRPLNPVSAYVLGFWYTDGNVCKKYSGIRLALAEQDKHILEDIARAMNYSGPLIFTPKRQESYQNQWSLCIGRQKLAKDLEALGCMPNKTFKCEFPFDSMTEDILPHFMRGLLDGDGSINRENKPYVRSPIVNFAGNLNMVEGFRKVCRDRGWHSMAPYQHTNGANPGDPELCAHTTSLSGHGNAMEFLRWVYKDKDSSLYLRRKYENFQSWLSIT